MLLHTFSSLALVAASTAWPSPTPKRPCVDFTVPVPVNAKNHKFNIPSVKSDIDTVDCEWSFETWSQPNINQRIEGSLQIDESFDISARLCVPPDGAKREILQVATHGGGFSKSCWDPSISPEKYSYVDAALKAGYSILIYDRLGTGSSQKPDAYTTVQGPVEVEILTGLIALARSGSLSKHISNSHDFNLHSTLSLPTFEKIVAVGHSIGSILTSALLHTHPSNISTPDATILTGYLLSSKRAVSGEALLPPGLGYARAQAESRFHAYPERYIVQSTRDDIQRSFFKKPSFEPRVLEWAYVNRDSNTVGESLGLPLITGLPALDYMGPVLLENAQYDFPVCNGDCVGTYDVDAMRKELYSRAEDFKVHIQPGSGHGLTLASNATGHFDVIMNYLNENGL